MPRRRVERTHVVVVEADALQVKALKRALRDPAVDVWYMKTVEELHQMLDRIADNGEETDPPDGEIDVAIIANNLCTEQDVHDIRERGVSTIRLAHEFHPAHVISNDGDGGARGYFPYSLVDLLPAAIRLVPFFEVNSLPYMSYVWKLLATGQVHDEELLSRLTLRELEVFQPMAEGANVKQTAKRLGVSERTVNSHRSQIYSKLGIDAPSAQGKTFEGTQFAKTHAAAIARHIAQEREHQKHKG